MKSKLDRISFKFNIIDVFDYLPFARCFNIIKYNKKSSKLYKLDSAKINYLKIEKVIKPTYKNIIKYIPNFTEKTKNNIEEFDKESDPKDILKYEKIFYTILNSNPNCVLINISKKYSNNLIKNINNINLEINPTVIQYFNNIDNEERAIRFSLLKNYRNKIKQITFTDFNKPNDINFQIRQDIKNLLNFLWESNTKRDYNKYSKVSKIIFKDNSIMSVLDINYIFIEICNILYSNKSNIEEFYINSKTARNDIKNINSFILTKIPNVKSIELNNFTFNNNSNSLALSNLLKNLKFINKLILSDSVCDNDNLNEILGNNNLKLKELKFKILYGDKNINWNFLNKFVDTLEVLEIELIFPDSDSLFLQISFNYKNKNTKQLFSMINKMKNLYKLTLIGDYLNNEDISYLQNNNIRDFTCSFYIINFELYKNKKSLPGFPFSCLDNISKMSLKKNNFNYKNKSSLSLTENYDGNDSACAYYKKKSYDLIIYEFPKFLSVLELNDFTDDFFLECYLIPLLNKNKEKLNQIKKLHLNKCFLDVIFFEKFLSILPQMSRLTILSINNIISYDKFKMKELLSYVPTILKNAPNLIILDISNNKYKESVFADQAFINLSNNIPKNLINLKVFNSEIPVSDKIISLLKQKFGKILLDYDNVKIKKSSSSHHSF